MKRFTFRVQVTTIFVVLLLWEVIGQSGLILKEVFPPFSTVLVQSFHLLFSGGLGEDATVTLYEILTGFLFGAIGGVVFGVMMGVNHYAYKLFEPLLYYFGAIPKIILFPVLILFLGTGMESKMGMAAVSAFFPIIVNTALAVRQVNPIHIRAARSLGASQWQIYSKVFLPSMFGPILAGMRLGLGVAITGTLLAESVVARAGLGFQTVEYYAQFRIPEMYAMILMLFVGAFLINGVISQLIHRATRYQGNQGQNPFS